MKDWIKLILHKIYQDHEYVTDSIESGIWDGVEIYRTRNLSCKICKCHRRIVEMSYKPIHE